MTLESTSKPTTRPSSPYSTSTKERGDPLGVSPETRGVEEEAVELLKGLKLLSKKAGGWIKDHYGEFKENLAITIEGLESVLFSPSSPPAALRRRTKKAMEEADTEGEDTLKSSELTVSTQDPSDSDSATTPSTSSTSLSSDSSSTSSSSEEVDSIYEEELDEETLLEEENDSCEEEEKKKNKATCESTNRTLFLVESESDDSWCNIDPES
jgi:hypothetical protein